MYSQFFFAFENQATHTYIPNYILGSTHIEIGIYRNQDKFGLCKCRSVSRFLCNFFAYYLKSKMTHVQVVWTQGYWSRDDETLWHWIRIFSKTVISRFYIKKRSIPPCPFFLFSEILEWFFWFRYYRTGYILGPTVKKDATSWKIFTPTCCM